MFEVLFFLIWQIVGITIWPPIFVVYIFLVFWRKQKAGELDFEELGIVLEDVEIPLLVITMLFSYKGRGTQQIWSSLCLQPDVPLSDLT